MAEAFQGRPTICHIDRSALRWNLRQIKARVGAPVKILSMVKANAYGHGAPAIARTLAAEGSDAFGVATLEEGVELRQAGIRQPIIVLAGVYPDQLDLLLQHELIPVLHELETLRALETAVTNQGVTLPIHVEIDTGMGRIGFLDSQINDWLPDLGKLKALKLQGFFSHFSDGETANEEYTKNQLKSFLSVAQRLRDVAFVPSLIHMAKSGTIITVPESYLAMVRPGLILYGIYPAPSMTKEIHLKPVLSWKTRILQLKRLPRSSSIGYGRTFTTKRDSFIATLPVGYADGYQRLFSNRAFVLVRGERAPVVGRVSMDLTTVDVTDIRNVQLGDEVVLLGRQDNAEITADEMAGWANTISYEIFTSISTRVPRIYVSCQEEH
jgi:alanine racemase